jgi:hypothetical protein
VRIHGYALNLAIQLIFAAPLEQTIKAKRKAMTTEASPLIGSRRGSTTSEPHWKPTATLATGKTPPTDTILA